MLHAFQYHGIFQSAIILLSILCSRDGNSSQRLGLESHLSRINKDFGLDLDSWTADSRLDLDSWLVRLVKNESFGIGVYMNVSLRETVCLKKRLNGIFFSSCLRIMHIKVVFITQRCFVYSGNQGNDV